MTLTKTESIRLALWRALIGREGFNAMARHGLSDRIERVTALILDPPAPEPVAAPTRKKPLVVS